MSTTPLLRDARAADLPLLLALEQLFPGDRLSRRQMARHIRGQHHAFRVLEDETGLLGYSLSFLRKGSRSARLYSLALAPHARGRGLGRMMLRDAERCAMDGACSILRLEVRADNTAAIALYQQAGYHELPSRPNFYEDGETARRFARHLPDP